MLKNKLNLKMIDRLRKWEKGFVKILIIISVISLILSLVLSLLGVIKYIVASLIFLLLFSLWLIIGYFKQTSEDKKITLILFIMVLLVLSLFVVNSVSSSNDASRIATIKSLFHDNTFETGKNIYSVDKVIIDDKFYSSKPPLLSFLGAGVYSIVWNVARFNGQDISSPNEVYFWITFFLITVPSALATVIFYKILGFTKIKEYYRLLLVFAFIFGTLIFSYSGTINNHTVAAAALLGGFYFIFLAKFEKIKKTRAAIVSGLFFALASTFDLTCFVWFLLFSVYFLFKKNYKLLGFYFLGAALPLIFHFSLNYHITGDLLPQYAHPEFYKYPGSRWPNGPAKENLEPWPLYLLNITVGHRGMLAYTPILFFSILGLIIQIKNSENKFWFESVFVLFGLFILLIIFLFVNSRNFSGNNYGFRWFIPVIPLIFFFTSFVFPNELKIYSKKYLWIYKLLLFLFFIILAYSVYIAYFGTFYVWDRIPPPFYFKLNNSSLI